jgi:hypothetical protein
MASHYASSYLFPKMLRHTGCDQSDKGGRDVLVCADTLAKRNAGLTIFANRIS